MVVVFAFIAAVVTVAAAAAHVEARRHGCLAPTNHHHRGRERHGATLASALSFSPQPGATSVAPDSPVVVHAGSGRLVSVRVTAANGGENQGAFASPQMWASTTPLGYGTTYHATALVSDGTATVERTATFQTMTPTVTVSASVFPSNGLTVGIGQPVVLRLSDEIITPAARTSLLQHITVKAAPPVAGGWYWFSPRELHFRPKAYWPSNEKVTVSWDLTGWNAGSGEWGAGAGSTHFTVGDAACSLVNLDTHTMTVTLNGQTVAVYPISGGKPKDPTMDGVHIVLDRESVVHMVSSTVGIPVNSPDGYDEMVFDDVHISDSGEYVHAAPMVGRKPGQYERVARLREPQPCQCAVVLPVQPGGRHRVDRGQPAPSGARRPRRHGLGHPVQRVHARSGGARRAHDALHQRPLSRTRAELSTPALTPG